MQTGIFVVWAIELAGALVPTIVILIPAPRVIRKLLDDSGTIAPLSGMRGRRIRADRLTSGCRGVTVCALRSAGCRCGVAREPWSLGA